jgi:hypothetical protein
MPNIIYIYRLCANILFTYLRIYGDTEGTCQDHCNLTNTMYDPVICTCVVDDGSMRMLEVASEWGRN